MVVSTSKVLFFISLIVGIVMSISSSSWLMIWIGLEINLLSFIPIISSTFNQYNSETTLKYFLIQALSSSCLLVGVFSMTLSTFTANLIVTLALLMKMGSAPFHFWFIEIMKQLSWMQIVLLNTFQKIAPMILISYTMHDYLSQNMIMLSVVMSSLLGGVGGMNQSFLNKIMAYSSLGHMGWMLQSMTMSQYLWMVYFSIYSLMLISVCMMLNLFKVKHLGQISLKMKENTSAKIMLSLSLMSMGGLPPFSGFMTKLLVIQQLMNTTQALLALILILSSLLNLFFYFRIILNPVILSSTKMTYNKMSQVSGNKNYFNLAVFFNFIMIFLPTLLLVFL